MLMVFAGDLATGAEKKLNVVTWLESSLELEDIGNIKNLEEFRDALPGLFTKYLDETLIVHCYIHPDALSLNPTTLIGCHNRLSQFSAVGRTRFIDEEEVRNLSRSVKQFWALICKLALMINHSVQLLNHNLACSCRVSRFLVKGKFSQLQYLSLESILQ